MPFPILGGKSITAEEDVVTNSCCFVDGDAAYMEITPGSDGNRRIFTFSCWFKRGVLGTAQTLFSAGSSEHNVATINFNTVDRLGFWEYDGDTDYSILTTRKLRDPAAWYHVVCTLDTTQGTEANRAKIYINGVQETVLTTDTYPSENYQGLVNTQIAHRVGKYGWTGAATWDGYMAEVVFIDGTAYAASDFGEFDENSPNVWIPKDVSGLTFGTNGFYLDFEASGNLGNDVNGGTDLTEVNLAATDQTADTPTNNFCTWNPVGNPRIDSGSLIEPDYSEGNTTVTHDNSSNVQATTTFFVNKGKWYMECECDAIGSGNTATLGILEDTDFGEAGETHVYRNNGNYVSGSYGDTFTSGDIISMAFDATNGTVWFAKNGTWQNSATEGEIEAGTTTNAAEASLDMTISWTIMTKGLSDNIMKANFGTAYADTVSSGNADGDGYGNFEYAVPDGFYALCTKNLAEYG